MHDPGTASIGCAENQNDLRVISDNAMDSAGFVRFEVPDARRWSIGFLYHDVAGGDLSSDTYSLTIVDSAGPNDIFAVHVARVDGILVSNLPSVRITSSLLRIGWNELAFRTSSEGTFLRLNDETVIEVPASQLARRTGWSRLCVGFDAAEEEPYLIRYSDLRTRFVREGISGSLTHGGSRDGSFEPCLTSTSPPLYIASNATDSWIVLDFNLPDTVNMPDTTGWNLAFAYHDDAFDADGVYSGGYSMALVSSSNISDTQYSVVHYMLDSETNRFNQIRPPEWPPGPRLNIGLGSKNRLELETSQYGTLIFVNGEKVSEVPSSELRPIKGAVRLCATYRGLPESYEIVVTDLWAWAD